MKPPRPIRISPPFFGKKKRKNRAPRRELEAPIQEAIFQYLQAALLQGSMIHHSPNEIGVRLEDNHRQMVIAKWKRLGMKAGWPDLEAFAAQKSLSQAQKDVRDGFRALGVAYCVARSVQDVEEFLLWEKIDTRLA